LSEKRLRAALITGAAKRIGRAIAKDLADNGFSVAIHANGSLAEAEEFAAELRQSGHRAVAVQGDLTKINETEKLIQKASDALGPLDLLVNNASIFHEDSLRAFDAGIWEEHFAVHLRAPSIPSERQLQEDFQAQVAALILKRGPELEEFGRTIRFLFETPSVTGQMIALDGGQHLAWQTPDVLEIKE